MSFEFTPDNFDDLRRSGAIQELTSAQRAYVSMRANRLLDEHVATLPEVFNKRDSAVGWRSVLNSESDVTHTARLWGIQKIAPKKCEHEGVVQLEPNFDRRIPKSERKMIQTYACKKCGKNLVARWEEAE